MPLLNTVLACTEVSKPYKHKDVKDNLQPWHLHQHLLSNRTDCRPPAGRNVIICLWLLITFLIFTSFKQWNLGFRCRALIGAIQRKGTNLLSTGVITSCGMLPVFSLTSPSAILILALSLSVSILPFPLNYTLMKHIWGVLHPSFPSMLSAGIGAVRKIEKFTTSSQVFVTDRSLPATVKKRFETRCQMLSCRGSKSTIAVKAGFGSHARFLWALSPSCERRAQRCCCAAGESLAGSGHADLHTLHALP